MNGHDHNHAHDHDHGHDHAHDHGHARPPAEPEFDPAGRSLASALQASFAILKLAMIAVLLLFALSGAFNVKEGSVAIRLRFGRIAGEPGSEVLAPGGPYFALPRPIDEVLFVPTSARQVALNDEFWFAVPEADAAKKIDELRDTGKGLAPEVDGSLLTGDRNIVHAKWTLTWKVRAADAALFVQCVGASPDAAQMMRAGESLVRTAAQRAVVHLAAETGADDLLVSGFSNARVQGSIQDALDRMRAGIDVTDVTQAEATPPIAVRAAFKEVTNAQSEKAKSIEDARREATRILLDAAGTAHEGLDKAIEAYEAARRARDDEAIRAAETALFERFAAPDVSGQAAQTLSGARTYRTRTVSQLRAEADEFQRQLPRYEENASLFRELRLQELYKEILGGDVEKFYMPAGASVYLESNRDPRIRKERERQKYRAETKKEE